MKESNELLVRLFECMDVINQITKGYSITVDKILRFV